VLAHLRVHPDAAFTPWELARVLGHSHGTIRRILMRLSAAGTVDQIGERPARFRHHR
jgi:DNA-binding GntR family transcriptional regulator